MKQEKTFIKIQLFGKDFPPLYGLETLENQLDEILKLDYKINELLVEREVKVETIKKTIEELKKKNKN